MDASSSPSPSPEVCRQWYKYGYCRFGRACKFEHVELVLGPPQERVGLDMASADANANANASASTNANALEHAAVQVTSSRPPQPLVCELCLRPGHSARLCVAHLVPDVVVQCTARRKQRLQQYFLDMPTFQALHVSVVPTDKEPRLIFLRTPEPSAVLRAAQLDVAINRHFEHIYTVRATCRTLDLLVDQVRSMLPSSSADTAARTSAPKVRIQAYPKTLRDQLLERMPGELEHDPKHFSHVLYLVHSYNRFHCALETSDHWFVHVFQRADSSLPSGATAAPVHSVPVADASSSADPPTSSSTYPPGSSTAPGFALAPSAATGAPASSETVVSRAYYKLHELFAVDPTLRIEPNMSALDIGAAPGGWTSYLASRGARVLSVDPGQLHIPYSPLVTHVPKKIEEGAEELVAHAPFDICVCDMNIFPSHAASIILSVVDHLAPRGLLVFTIKELEAGRANQMVMRCFHLLAPAFDEMSTRYLLSNGRERTMIARRRVTIDVAGVEQSRAEIERLRIEREERKQRYLSERARNEAAEKEEAARSESRQARANDETTSSQVAPTPVDGAARRRPRTRRPPHNPQRRRRQQEGRADGKDTWSPDQRRRERALDLNAATEFWTTTDDATVGSMFVDA